jgi:hypothetical protein
MGTRFRNARPLSSRLAKAMGLASGALVSLAVAVAGATVPCKVSCWEEQTAYNDWSNHYTTSANVCITYARDALGGEIGGNCGGGENMQRTKRSNAVGYCAAISYRGEEWKNGSAVSTADRTEPIKCSGGH